MKKNLISKCFFLVLFLFACIPFLFVCADENVETEKILLEDDFSDKKVYSVNTGTYTDSLGIGNPAPAVHIKKGERLTHSVSSRSSGVYILSFDFMKPEAGGINAFAEITDARGSANAAYLTLGSNGFYLQCYDVEGKLQSVLLDENFIPGKWYSFSLRVNIDAKIIQVYIDGRRVGKETVACLNPAVNSIGRFLDSRCYASEYYIDNVYICEDLIAEEILFCDIGNVSDDIILPASGQSGGKAIWESDNEAVLASDGKLVAVPEYSVSVKLTANITKGSITQKREYYARVLGSKGSIIKAQPYIDEFYYSDSYRLPKFVTCTTENGEIIERPVVWENTFDKHLLDEWQIIYGDVANGEVVVKAQVKVLSVFTVQRISFKDSDGQVIVSALSGGNISSVGIRKNTSDTLNGNIKVSLQSGTGDVLNEKIISLETVGNWAEKETKIIPVNMNLQYDNIDLYTIKVSVTNENDDSYLTPYEYSVSRQSEGVPDVIVVGDSVVACAGRVVSNNKYYIKGWTEELYNFFDNEIAIKNFSNYKERITKIHNYNTVKEAIGQNDYLLIAFGNTDVTVCPKSDYPDIEEFRKSLTAYVNDMGYEGAIPILLTPIATSGSDYELQTIYAETIRNIAKEYEIPLLDLEKKTTERFSQLYDDIYWDENGRLLTFDGATQICKIIVEELDKIEVSIKPHMWYDVVNSVTNSENSEDAKYRVHKLSMVDDKGNEVYRFSDANKITEIVTELCVQEVQNSDVYIAIYKNEKLIHIDKYEIFENLPWQKNTLKSFPMVVDLSSYSNSDITVKVMIWNENSIPYCRTYKLSK